MLDIFNQDAFSVRELTLAINALPLKPTRIEELGLFREEPITTPHVNIESEGGILRLIPATPRGTTTRVYATGKRVMRTLPVPHLSLGAEVLADEVSGVRAFGTEDQLETVSDLVNRKMQGCKNDHDATHEWHRIGAIHGVVLDADGTTELLDLFAIFGVVEKVVDFDFSVSGAALKLKALEVIEHIEDNLGGQPYDHVHALVGKNVWNNMMANADLNEAYNAQTNYAFALEQQRQPLAYADIIWEPYRAKVGVRSFIDPDTIRFFPVGAPDLFVRANAPAAFNETVNQPGLPYYAKQERKPFDTGVDILTVSCPAFFASRPAVLVKGTDSTP